MLTSHLAIIDRHGLRTICDDTAETYALLTRQIDNLNYPPSVLIWTVLPDHVFARIRHYLRLGDGHAAWLLMQYSADQFGTLRTSPNLLVSDRAA